MDGRQAIISLIIAKEEYHKLAKATHDAYKRFTEAKEEVGKLLDYSNEEACLVCKVKGVSYLVQHSIEQKIELLTITEVRSI